MAANSRQLRAKAEALFLKAGRWWIGARRSRRLYHRAVDYQHAARLAERRELEAHATAYDTLRRLT